MQQAPLTCYTQRVAPMYTRRQTLMLVTFLAGLSCVLGGITRGPLISLPVPGAIYIRWVTDVVATNRIDLGFTPSYEAASWPTPSASEHQVVLTGAPAGAVIYYSLELINILWSAGIVMTAADINMAFAQAALPLGWTSIVIRIIQNWIDRIDGAKTSPHAFGAA